jgi:hypothetical protein
MPGRNSRGLSPPQDFRLEFAANSEMVFAYEKSGSARFVSARTAAPVNVVYSNETELPK